MRSMQCVIIGAGGFIGRHLGAALIARGHGVAGFDVVVPPRVDAPFEVEQVDVVRDELPLPTPVDVVYYLAQSPRYRDFPAPGAAEELFGVTLIGAIRAAVAARRRGARLFCFASTGSVYAPSFQPMSEDHPVRRDDPYALSKLTAEEALGMLQSAIGPSSDVESMRVLRARLFGVFGPGQSRMLVPALIHKIRTGAPIQIEPHPHDAADRNGLRITLSYVEDVCACLIQLAEVAGAEGTGGRSALPPVVNVAGLHALDIRTLSEQLGAAMGMDPRFEMLPAAQARRSDFLADISLLRRLVNVDFTPLEEAIARTVAPLAVSHAS